jgi:hypothetical protein
MAKQDRSRENGGKDRKYPYYGYEPCRKLANAVSVNGGDRIAVPKSMVAQALEVDQGSGSFAQLVASAKTWGFVDGFAELSLTELAREYFYPTTANGKRVAELNFLIKPTAYAFLVKYFDGSRLPGTPLLGNVMGKNCGVPKSWQLRAAQIFVNAAEELNVLEGGYLRYHAAVHAASLLGGPSHIEPPMTSPQMEEMAAAMTKHFSGSTSVTRPLQTTSPPSTSSAQPSNVWTWSEDGGTVRLETSIPLPLPLWQRLEKYVEAIKPANSNKEG